MRAISPHAGYVIQVFEGHEQVVVDARGYAQSVPLEKPVLAKFTQGGLLDYEVEAALEYFNFSGVPEGVNPLTRVSSFDLEAYCQQFPENQRDEKYVAIDKRMRELAERFPSEFRIIDPPRKAQPWPSYDEDSIADILKFQERLRIKPEAIRLYEVENKNRQKIIDAMFQAEDPDYVPGGEEIVVEG